MPRRVKQVPLEKREDRKKLAVRTEPYWLDAPRRRHWARAAPSAGLAAASKVLPVDAGSMGNGEIPASQIIA